MVSELNDDFHGRDFVWEANNRSGSLKHSSNMTLRGLSSCSHEKTTGPYRKLMNYAHISRRVKKYLEQNSSNNSSASREMTCLLWNLKDFLHYARNYKVNLVCGPLLGAVSFTTTNLYRIIMAANILFSCITYIITLIFLDLLCFSNAPLFILQFN
jgi:hypothetical protein